MTATPHTDRVSRYRLAADLVFGYEKVIRDRFHEDGYLSRLYAVENNERATVWTRLTRNPDAFTNGRAIWEKAGVSADMMAQKCAFVGHYDADKIRKH